MRPTSIIRFEQLFLTSLAIGVINVILTWDTTMAAIQADPNSAALGPNFAYITTAFGFGINLLLWYLAARKAVGAVKWILLVLMVIGVLALPSSFAILPPLNLAIGLVLTIMQAIAVYMLFRPDSKKWFVGEKTVDLDKTFE
ncbi:MAG: hypothetical protein ABJP02_17175 [Parasphingorhabdus sp.]|uniref:hypothetical protein n=1 Tax=Parasphingorhabdus sp. TaxID=2709688 RepID=UPI0032971F79